MATRRTQGIVGASAVAVVFCCLPLTGADGGSAAPAAGAPPAGSVKELMTRPLLGASGKEIRMITVEYLPGGTSLPHRHNAQVFVYVLEGTVRMQVRGSPTVTLGPGGTFYEGPEDIHTVSANASQTKPAKLLVFMIKDVGAPVSVAVPDPP
jgi:quercetin dioxygenase-like cupin family protein